MVVLVVVYERVEARLIDWCRIPSRAKKRRFRRIFSREREEYLVQSIHDDADITGLRLTTMARTFTQGFGMVRAAGLSTITAGIAIGTGIIAAEITTITVKVPQ